MGVHLILKNSTQFYPKEINGKSMVESQNNMQ